MVNIDYSSYLQNKRVAIVGPASYLSKLNTGSYIDSFDIVVRINRGTELIESHSDSIGTRTDILYNCLIKSPDNGGALDVKKYYKSGIKWISTIPGSDINGVCKSNKLHKMVSWFTVFKLKKNFNFHVMDFREYSKVNKSVESRANTGFAAIFDLLNYNISELYITGYSFYLDDFMSGYKDGCTRESEEFARQCFVSQRHKQKPQWEHLKSAVLSDNRIQVDPVLKKILNMDDLSRNYDTSKILN